MAAIAITITMSGQRGRVIAMIGSVPRASAEGMMAGCAPPCSAPSLRFPLLAALVIVAATPSATAGKPKRYHIELIEVTAAAGLPAETADVAARVCTAEWTKVLASAPAGRVARRRPRPQGRRPRSSRSG
jgi:hypothetical protein